MQARVPGVDTPAPVLTLSQPDQGVPRVRRAVSGNNHQLNIQQCLRVEIVAKCQNDGVEVIRDVYVSVSTTGAARGERQMTRPRRSARSCGATTARRQRSPTGEPLGLLPPQHTLLAPVRSRAGTSDLVARAYV
ncbi:unnamed protein product [Arctia plantaginis]|uniref:Uncharacterized protein n=1 Tax=Arctia plantaginis TaxID=874455 RepID=A0A8S0ZQW7_ARCPL|nr:unnamed protein product [Arctia plantaginis]